MVRVSHFHALGAIASTVDPVPERLLGEDVGAVEEEKWGMLGEGRSKRKLPVLPRHICGKAINPTLSLSRADILVVGPSGASADSLGTRSDPAIFAGRRVLCVFNQV